MISQQSTPRINPAERDPRLPAPRASNAGVLLFGAAILAVAAVSLTVDALQAAGHVASRQVSSDAPNPSPNASPPVDLPDHADRPDEESVSPPAGTGVFVLPTKVDFGSVQSGARLTATVELVNSGDDPVRVLRAVTGCGCTLAEIPDESIAPGATSPVEIRFRPTGRVGIAVRKTVHFVFDGKREPVSLSLLATPTQLLSIEPTWVDFSREESPTVTVRSTDDTRFNIEAVVPPILTGHQARSPARAHQLSLSAELWRQHGSPRTLNLQLDHDRVQELAITARGAASAGARKARIGLRPTNGADHGLDRVVSPHPRRLRFGSFGADTPATQDVVLWNLHLSADEVPRVELHSTIAGAEIAGWSTTPDATLVTVRLRAHSADGGYVRGPMHIRVGSQRWTVEVFARVVAHPQESGDRSADAHRSSAPSVRHSTPGHDGVRSGTNTPS